MFLAYISPRLRDHWLWSPSFSSSHTTVFDLRTVRSGRTITSISSVDQTRHRTITSISSVDKLVNSDATHTYLFMSLSTLHQLTDVALVTVLHWRTGKHYTNSVIYSLMKCRRRLSSRHGFILVCTMYNTVRPRGGIMFCPGLTPPKFITWNPVVIARPISTPPKQSWDCYVRYLLG